MSLPQSNSENASPAADLRHPYTSFSRAESPTDLMKRMIAFQSRFNPVAIFKLAAALGIFGLFVMGAIEYPGSRLVYAYFSVVFTCLLVSGFYRQGSYGYLFLALFLWLGFWFKLTVHMILDRPFVEAVGGFYGHELAWFDTNIIPPAAYSLERDLQWDEVLNVAVIATFGVLLARFLWLRNFEKEPLRELGKPFAPTWYPANRKWIWPLVLLTTVAVSIVNMYWGVLLIGVAPKTIFPWPLNAAISWMVGTGCAIGIATLAWWDLSLKKKSSTSIFAILIEGFFSTVSLLSRSAYIFHVIPQLLALILSKQRFPAAPARNKVIAAAAFMLLFFASITVVTELRTKYYSQATTSIQPTSRPEILQSIAISKLAKNSYDITLVNQLKDNFQLESEIRQRIAAGENLTEQLESLLRQRSAIERTLLSENDGFLGIKKYLRLLKFYIGNILAIIGDRWVGLEGVMAVSAYEAKGHDMFMAVLTEEREIGKASIYQQICNSLYQGVDNEKFLFASLPGVVAFLFISNSMALVFLGSLSLVMLMLVAERAVRQLTHNPLICALFGLAFANTISQFGIAPLQNGTYFLMWFIGVGFIWLLQSKHIDQITRRLSSASN